MTVKALQVVVSGSVEGTATHMSENLIAMPTKKPRKPRTPKTTVASTESKCIAQFYHHACIANYLQFFFLKIVIVFNESNGQNLSQCCLNLLNCFQLALLIPRSRSEG